jgi:DNA polymerase-3 subunit epsilon/oligoribonuclease
MLGLFLDIETTGLDPSCHVPIDIAIIALDLNLEEKLATYQTVICQPLDAWQKSDPESLKINGYTFDAISQGKRVLEVKKEIIALFQDLGVQKNKSFFICQNPAFDRGFFNQIIPVYEQQALGWPYHWLDLASMYWMTKEPPYPEQINLSKNAIASHFQIEKETVPHRAIGGASHLLTCYLSVKNWRHL